MWDKIKNDIHLLEDKNVKALGLQWPRSSGGKNSWEVNWHFKGYFLPQVTCGPWMGKVLRIQAKNRDVIKKKVRLMAFCLSGTLSTLTRETAQWHLRLQSGHEGLRSWREGQMRDLSLKLMVLLLRHWLNFQTARGKKQSSHVKIWKEHFHQYHCAEETKIKA